MESKELHLQKFHLIIIVFFLFIAGCAQKIPKNVDINPHWRTLIDEQETWQVRGRIAFISPKSRQSAQFNWHYKNNKHRCNHRLFEAC